MNFVSRYIAVSVCALIILQGCSVAPVPLKKEEVAGIARLDRGLIFDAQEEIEGELTLELAMAMGLKYNLENRVRLLEEAVANQQLSMTKTELLPSLAASAGYAERSNVNASRSVSVSTGQESLEPSTSQDLTRGNTNARFSWNLLDFGVSYLQAKQDADRFLIAQKAREKVMLTLLKEVRGAYWQAVAMEEMRDDLDYITGEVDKLLAYWEAVRAERLRPPVAVLMDIRALIETRQQLDELRRTIDTASARLANLINAKDFQALKLPRAQSFPALDDVTDDIEALEIAALANSADYANEIYKVRIDQLESRKAMIRLLPGLEFSYSESYDDNSFLLNQRWGEFGLNLTGDLTQLMFTKRIRKFRETNEQLTIGRKLAINMAVITGVHITWQDYKNALVQLQRAEYLQQIDEQISNLTDNAEANKKETGAAAIQNELRAFRSRISQMQSYADAQQAYGDLVVSLGVNPIPAEYQQLPVRDLAEQVAGRLKEQVFPYTKEGETLLAERRQLDKWVGSSVAVVDEAKPEAIPEDYVASEDLVRDTKEIVVESAEAVLEEQTGLSDLAAVLSDNLSDNVEEAPMKNDVLLVENELVDVNTEPPTLSEFLAHFWLKYLPQPNLDDYLQEYLNNLPDGPNKEAYLKLFIENLPDGPDRQSYLDLFLERIKQSPSLYEYMDDFKPGL